MAISFVGSASANGDSVVLPSHQAGDLIIYFAYRHDSTTEATVPVGKNLLTKGEGAGGQNNSLVCAHKTAETSSETSGTFTNATQLAVVIYRSDSSKYLAVGAGTARQTTSTNFTYPTIGRASLADYSGNSWIVAGVGSRTDQNADVAPSGMTNRTSSVSTGEIAVHDTNSGVTFWLSTNVATTSVAYRLLMMEIYETTLDITSAGGGVRQVNIRGGADQ